MAKKGSQSGLVPQIEWLTFKRKSDGNKVEARLVTLQSGKKMMQIKEVRTCDLLCPSCQTILTMGNAQLIPNFLLEVTTFHERHTEYGRPRK